MNNVKVVTTMSQEYWDKVGQYSVSTWPNFMPEGWKFWLHDSPDLPLKYDLNFKSEEKYKWWKIAEKKVETISEEQLPYGYQREWKVFSHKVFAQIESYRKDPTGIMMWCDSDVKWKKSPSTEFLKECLNGKFCAYLGRDRVNPAEHKKRKYKKLPNETCILIYNLENPMAEEFFNTLEDVYLSLRLFDGYDWSDCGAFETAMIESGKENFNDLALPHPPAINPLPLTVLDEYFEHWMGWTNKNAREDIKGKKEKNKILKRLGK